MEGALSFPEHLGKTAIIAGGLFSLERASSSSSSFVLNFAIEVKRRVHAA